MTGDRRITRTWTPHGWIEWLEPDWDRVREALDRQPELTVEERLAASLRYVRALWAETRPRSGP